MTHPTNTLHVSKQTKFTADSGSKSTSKKVTSEFPGVFVTLDHSNWHHDYANGNSEDSVNPTVHFRTDNIPKVQVGNGYYCIEAGGRWNDDAKLFIDHHTARAIAQAYIKAHDAQGGTL